MKEEKQHERIDRRDGKRREEKRKVGKDKMDEKNKTEGENERRKEDMEKGRQIEAMGRGRRGGGGGPSGAPSYCGRAFRMAFTSSATAVSANSNWSCRETKKGSLMSAIEAAKEPFGKMMSLLQKLWPVNKVLQDPTFVPHSSIVSV